ncbi:hypothetical protein C5167_039616 [Papaver somniferum]|uniref:MORF/ORRM1/DAG-like MORF domain-containing protein n=1 Tax=Papaver somniferum TaxID=3469 RepID=A0A4Y7IF44_PAPSO|nr:multiple organellar RNA editing factor 8, chloroplastic/mitochondrial-like [Papaver somniferum]RZC46666.1 hypothetical protein C5167_039616 [Papaver somniferum]
MAVALCRALMMKTIPSSATLSRSLLTSSSIPVSQIPLSVRSFSHLTRVRPLVAFTEFRNRFPSATLGGLKCLSTRATSSSLNDPQPNWNNRPPKETILLDGCDFEHWLIVMEKPEGDPTRDEIIDSYINTLSKVIGSEDEARMKIYSVSTRHYFAFGALVSEELSYKIKELPGVRWVLPDSYLNVREKDYGGEHFIDGKAVPYDPKYHEEWVRNNARANERSRRNDRPRNNDRSRNFERRRENMQSRDFQPNQPGSPPGGMPHNPNMQNPGGIPPNRNMQNPGQNMGGMPPNSNMQNPGQNMGGMPPNGNMHQNMGGPPGVHMQPNVGGMQHNAYAQNNMGGMPPNANMRGAPSPNAGHYNNNMPNSGGGQYRDAPPQGGGAPYQGGPPRDFNPNGNYQ